MVHKFSRIANFVVFCVLEKSQSATTTETRENSTCSSGWPSAKRGSDQSKQY